MQSIAKINAASAPTVQLPPPSPTVIYTPALDVIPVSKGFLEGTTSYDEYFGTMYYYTKCKSLSFYFANSSAFANFKTWLKLSVSQLGAILPLNTKTLIRSFDTLTLTGLTECFTLRRTPYDNNQEYSFARFIVTGLLAYMQHTSPSQIGVLPFSLNELYCPKSLVLINVEAHANAAAADIAHEWDLINQALIAPIPMISQSQIIRLDAVQRESEKLLARVAYGSQGDPNDVCKHTNKPFSLTQSTGYMLGKALKQISKKVSDVNRSTNTYTVDKLTYNRPSRRNPDDINSMGKLRTKKYKPNIHIYLDTSGSINENNYRSMVMACITLAIEMNVDLYMNSFASRISTCTHLKLQGKTPKQAYREFLKVYKVSGGTEFEPVWNYINASKIRQKEISIIITDFEYDPPSEYNQKHDRIFYTACADMDWPTILEYTSNFCENMMHIDPHIRGKILF